MIYAARQLVAGAFTPSAVNTQITALNSALGTSATALAIVLNGLTGSPQDATGFPALVYWVGLEDNATEVRRFGKRDTGIALRLLYLSRHATLAAAETDIEIALEALQTVLETLPGQQHGATARYCVDVRDIAHRLVEYTGEGEVIRHGGEVTATLLMRTEGL